MHPKLRLDFTAVNTGFPRVPQYNGFACSSTVHDLLSCFMSFTICFSWLLFFSSLLLFCLVLFVFLLFFHTVLWVYYGVWKGEPVVLSPALVHFYLISLFLSPSVTQWLDLDSLVSQFRVERSNSFLGWKSMCRNRKKSLQQHIIFVSLCRLWFEIWARFLGSWCLTGSRVWSSIPSLSLSALTTEAHGCHSVIHEWLHAKLCAHLIYGHGMNLKMASISKNSLVKYRL